MELPGPVPHLLETKRPVNATGIPITKPHIRQNPYTHRPHPVDRIRIILDTVYLTDEAANVDTTVEGFRRNACGEGKKKSDSLILTLALGRYGFLRIVCHRMTNGVWRVSCIDANLPAHLFGHNARPIRTTHELALALTRVQYFVSLVVLPECHNRIVPGVGIRNRGYIQYVEAMIQLQDPGHCLLLGTHVANQCYQHKASMVVWGEATTFKGKELGLRFYDKHAQRKIGILDPKGVESTRIECIVSNADRLAKEVKDTKAFTGPAGEVVSTLSLESAYAVLLRNLGRCSGFGSIVGELPAKLSKTSKLLLMGLGSHFDKPHAVDLVLENYRRSHNPCERTFRTVNNEVREHAHHFIAPDALALVPTDFQDLKWSNVLMPATERDFNVLVRDMGAPSTPDPQIIDAWSKTTFLATKPVGGNSDGPHLPCVDLPWKNTL
jgi:hypothetical protein